MSEETRPAESLDDYITQSAGVETGDAIAEVENAAELPSKKPPLTDAQYIRHVQPSFRPAFSWFGSILGLLALPFVWAETQIDSFFYERASQRFQSTVKRIEKEEIADRLAKSEGATAS